MITDLGATTLHDLSARHPAIAAFLVDTDPGGARPTRTFASWLTGLSDDRLVQIGMDRDLIANHVKALLADAETRLSAPATGLRSLRLLGGRDKRGLPEDLDLTLTVGDVVCIVGPTGSGKSRLLADIECLAQGDTPSGRRVLINGAPPDASGQSASDHRMIAQISQNMNFVVDLTVEEFLSMHAECRMITEPAAVVRDVIVCANTLAGERFAADTSLTQLSGGQTRALMIADTALLSDSPIVLIDEIENAGIDRKRALQLLIAQEKIVLISTHDPILALLGHRRLVIAHGAVARVIETGADERANLERLEAIDAALNDVRARLRRGERIAEVLPWPVFVEGVSDDDRRADAAA